MAVVDEIDERASPVDHHDDGDSGDKSVAKSVKDSGAKKEDDPSNISSVYYLHPTETLTSGANKVLLNGTNYLNWKREFMMTLSFKNKLGFVDGSIPQPPLDSKLCLAWVRCNTIVSSWILYSLNEEIRSTVMFIENAKDLWEKICTRYSHPDLIRIYRLQMELYSMAQGTQPVAVYFGRMSKVWEELRLYRPLPTCICETGRGKAYNCVACNTEIDKIFQFLMGLNADFDQMRSPVIMKALTLTLDEVYGIVLQEESQQMARGNVTNSGNNNKDSSAATYAVNSSGVNTKRKGRSYCDHCGKSGHTSERCYRLIGFPPNFKFTKKPAYSRNDQGASSSHYANQVSAAEVQNQYSQMKMQMQNLMNVMDQTVASGQCVTPSHPQYNQGTEGSSVQGDVANNQDKFTGSFFRDQDWTR